MDETIFSEWVGKDGRIFWVGGHSKDFVWSGEEGSVWVQNYFECMEVVGGIYWEGGGVWTFFMSE